MSDIDFSPMKKKPETPKVGVAVMIWKYENGRDHLLLGLRRGSHAAGEWAPPGGHVDMGETFAEACIRETFEECGITIEGIYHNRPFITEDIMVEEGLHYITVFCTAEWDRRQEPVLKPDEKFDEWRWVPRGEWHSMKLFMPLAKRLQFEW